MSNIFIKRVEINYNKTTTTTTTHFSTTESTERHLQASARETFIKFQLFL